MGESPPPNRVVDLESNNVVDSKPDMVVGSESDNDRRFDTVQSQNGCMLGDGLKLRGCIDRQFF